MTQQRNFVTQFTRYIPFENSIPFLYRYEDKIWIDEFFSTGNIKLSTFLSYQNYSDNQLGDAEEGNTFMVLEGNNDMVSFNSTQVGITEYCFCTSTILNHDLKSTFSRDSVFRIDDPLNFMIEISNCIPRISGVLFGNCVYLDDKVIKERADIELIPDNDIDFELKHHSVAFKRKRYFAKKMMYQPQSEYRMLFSVNREVKDSVIINCPEARQFCSRL